jgi:hypothetical protein
MRHRDGIDHPLKRRSCWDRPSREWRGAAPRSLPSAALPSRDRVVSAR